MNLGKSFEIPKESKTATKSKINIKPKNILSDIWTIFFSNQRGSGLRMRSKKYSC